MSFKKVVIAAGLISGMVFAGVLDTNDVKMNTNMGLGANPAAIAVNKKASLEIGTMFLNKTKQNSKILNPMQLVAPNTYKSVMTGSDVNSSSVADAGKFINYTYKIGDNWLALRYAYESNLYPNMKLELDSNPTKKVTMSKKDATEKLSLVAAKELAKGLTGGVELASNTWTYDDKAKYNAAAGGTETNAFSVSKPYYTVMLGLVKEINDVSKVTFAHKFSQSRGIYYNSDTVPATTYVYNELMPAETALSYIYKVNNSLEVAGIYKAFAGVTYEKNVLGSKKDYTETIVKSPYNNLGFAADYKINDKWSLQGYGNFIRNYKRMVTSGDSSKPANSTTDYGWNVTQLGANVQYAVMPNGTILLGSYVTKLLSEDKDVNMLFDITNTHISYSYAF